MTDQYSQRKDETMSPRKLIRYAGFDPGEHIGNIRDPHKISKPCGKSPKLITFDDKTMNITEWAAHLGIPGYLLRNRLKTWSLERALTPSHPIGPANV